jgi:hypothetical protein
MRSAKELAERRFQQKEEGAKALTDYQAKEHATRLLPPSYGLSAWRAKANLTEAKGIARLRARPSKRLR